LSSDYNGFVCFYSAIGTIFQSCSIIPTTSALGFNDIVLATLIGIKGVPVTTALGLNNIVLAPLACGIRLASAEGLYYIRALAEL
jgi:hypothetical protein